MALSETRDGMRIDWDIVVEMDDCLAPCADVFRPAADWRRPVLFTYGVLVQEGYPSAWDRTRHDGIVSTFWANWYDMQVKTVPNGLGERGPRSEVTGELVCGPDTLDEATLAANRCDFGRDILAHPLEDDYYRARPPGHRRCSPAGPCCTHPRRSNRSCCCPSFRPAPHWRHHDDH